VDTVITFDELLDRLARIEHGAERFERQTSYAGAGHLVADWHAGRLDPTTDRELAEWYRLVADGVEAGRRFRRLRVMHEPMTDFQHFEDAMSRWNIEAGEWIRHVTWSVATEVGLLDELHRDFWLLDRRVLVTIIYDPAGAIAELVVTTKAQPVAHAAHWFETGWQAGVDHGSP
jgi:hypothetical protein